MTMTDDRIDTETAQDAADTPARPGTLRRVLAKRRSDRRGALGSTEMVQLIGVILLIALLAGGTFVYLRFIRGSSENSVVQRNIDEVAKLADSYWQNYAADVDGRRKISLAGFCQFANSQVAAEDLNLRTLQLVSAAAAPAIAAPSDTFDMADSVITRTISTPRSTANCPNLNGLNGTDANVSSLDEYYHDILARDGDGTASTSVGAGQLASTGSANEAATVFDYTGSTGTQSADDHNNALEAAGLLSTKTVWMAQYGSGSAISGFVPAGTDTTFDPDGARDFGTEFLVFGGMSPSGDSFCLIKVFDASNNDQIGEYRLSRLATDDFQFTTCGAGADGTGVNLPRRGGKWPEPQ
ncbi:hypothetical protein [Candidatus Poriferisodalis sp.]|uniref:hypothetical protein n=1 Tax=Candidatus Poriferisodalis sp. TaxID=3101277 RepID=UPI003B024CE4